MYFVLHAEEMAERDNNGMENDMILLPVARTKRPENWFNLTAYRSVIVFCFCFVTVCFVWNHNLSFIKIYKVS